MAPKKEKDDEAGGWCEGEYGFDAGRSGDKRKHWPNKDDKDDDQDRRSRRQDESPSWLKRE